MERKGKGTDQHDLLTVMLIDDFTWTQVKIRGCQMGRYQVLKIAEKEIRKDDCNVYIDLNIHYNQLYRLTETINVLNTVIFLYVWWPTNKNN